jgi:hypothetical protein
MPRQRIQDPSADREIDAIEQAAQRQRAEARMGDPAGAEPAIEEASRFSPISQIAALDTSREITATIAMRSGDGMAAPSSSAGLEKARLTAPIAMPATSAQAVSTPSEITMPQWHT